MPDYSELVYMHEQMDPDYLVDILDISSDELIRAFPDKFRDYINKEFEMEYEEEDHVYEEYNETDETEE